MLGGGWNRCVSGGWMGGRLGLRAGSLWPPRGVEQAGRVGYGTGPGGLGGKEEEGSGRAESGRVRSSARPRSSLAPALG